MRASPPFKSELARDRYLARYAERAKAWPVVSEERVVPTSFGQTFVRVSGPESGAPLLCLPGIGSTGLSLGTVVQGLSGPLRTFVIDNIHDVGRSVESKVVTSAHDFASWLDEVRLGLGLRTVDLLGLSYGGVDLRAVRPAFPRGGAPGGVAGACRHHRSDSLVNRRVLTFLQG